MDNYIDKIEQKIFHGINLDYYNIKLEDLEILKMILESGKIMTRKELSEIKYEYLNNLPKIYEQSENEICFAIHPKNKLYKYVYNDEDFSDAFYKYIRFNISFVFSNNIINNKYSLYGIPGEVRIENSIKLKNNLIAIGCFDEIEYLLEKTKTIRNKNILFGKELLDCNDIYEYTIKKEKRTYAVTKILNEYGYDIPIIDPVSGKIIKSNYDDDVKKVKKIKNMLINN